MSFSMKIYFRPLLYPFEKILVNSKNAGFLKKPKFYLLVFIYVIKFSNLIIYLKRVDKFD